MYLWLFMLRNNHIVVNNDKMAAGNQLLESAALQSGDVVSSSTLSLPLPFLIMFPANNFTPQINGPSWQLHLFTHFSVTVV